jgi:hypothetical protein
VCERDCTQGIKARDPTFYTQTLSGTCTKKRSREIRSDSTDPDYLLHEMREDI